jgi:2-desacetyl-2-hydroxyethyl bacteriochlorophyllide A dehydrogenase
LPLILGHEFSGRILQVGKGVEGFEIGDPVVASPISTCGLCPDCQDGNQQGCIHRSVMGLQRNGVFAEKVSVPAKTVYKLPTTVDLEVAALCEPLNTIIRAYEKGAPQYGDTVLISGPGPMGMLALLMGQYCGCGRIIMTGLNIDKKRLRIAEKLGAVTINLESENISDRVKDITGGAGVDLAIETSGNSKAITQDLNLLSRRGRMILVGFSEDPCQFLPISFLLNETIMTAVRSYTPKTWRTCLKVVSSGRLNLESVISHRLPLDEVEMGFQLLQQREGLKILIKPLV